MKLFLKPAWALLFAFFIPHVASACGSDTKCQIKDRHYFITMPEGHDGKTPVPAILFAHGYQGSGLGISRNPRLRRVASDLGLAFIAVKSKGQSWSLRNSPSGNTRTQDEEMKYFDNVINDITDRFPIDRDRIIMSGASTGGMVTWALACERSDVFAAFIPMSGTFWDPVPRTCKGPVANIVHFHGDKDRTVPLGGRPVAGTHQGSVPQAFEMYRRFGRFGSESPQSVGALRCQVSKNSDRNILNFCLYDGGHSFRSDNIKVAWKMLRAAGKI